MLHNIIIRQKNSQVNINYILSGFGYNLPIQYQPRNTGQTYHRYGMKIIFPKQDKRYYKNNQAFIIDKIFSVYQ